MTGPNPFFDPEDPSPVYSVNQRLPNNQAGVVEAFKRAVMVAMRDALSSTGSVSIDGEDIYIDLEYPLKQVQYPGIWVQFSLTKLNRAGIGHEIPLKEDDNWCLIQEWEFNGRVTMSLAALTNKDRDRLADLVIANLAFSRSPDLVITKPKEDAKEYKSLLDNLNSNPYIAMTLNTDEIYPGGQDVNVGAPWDSPQGQATLVYTDSYAFDVLGQFNVKLSHEGIYTLARIDVLPEMLEESEWPSYDPYQPYTL